MPINPSTITMDQACQILGMTRRILMRRIQKGYYPAPPKDGRDYNITFQWVRDIMRRRELELTKDKLIMQLHKEAQEMRERVAERVGADD